MTKQYKVTFITLDGNTQAAYVDAPSYVRARMIFENEYQFESIQNIEEII